MSVPSAERGSTGRHNADNEDDHAFSLVPENVESTLTRRLPPADDHLSAEKIAYSLSNIGFSYGWPSFVPTRVRDEQHVYMATNAMLKVFQAFALNHSPEHAKVLCSRDYVLTLSALRSRLGRLGCGLRDCALLSAVMLLCFDWILEPHGSPACCAHLRGVSALLLTIPRHEEISEVSRAVLMSHHLGTFQTPVALGTSSPFEEPRWLEAEPCNQSAPYPLAVAKLIKIQKDLFIRLPRLISLVRASRQRQVRMTEIVELASSLYRLRDPEAESELLHSVGVRKTMNPLDMYVAPWSLRFNGDGTGQFHALVFYWQARILVQRLCLQIRDNIDSLRPSRAEDFSEMFTLQQLPTQDSIRADNIRLATNIIMAWEFAAASERMGTWGLRIGFLTVWAVAQDNTHWRANGKAIRVEIVRKWLIRRYNDLHRGHRVFKESEMDDAANMLTGGPLKGFLLDILR